MTTLSISDARKKLPTLIKKASENLEEFSITNNGEEKAVIISSAEYDSWKETVEILSDSSLMRKIALGLTDIKTGDLIAFE